MKYFACMLAIGVALCANSADSQTLTTLVEFTGIGGANPQGDLTLSGTTLYGMTVSGGANGYGSIFSVGIGGTNYHTIISFTGTGGTANGHDTNGSLTLSGTTLYGMTQWAAATIRDGNIFSVAMDGTNYQSLLFLHGHRRRRERRMSSYGA